MGESAMTTPKPPPGFVPLSASRPAPPPGFIPESDVQPDDRMDAMKRALSPLLSLGQGAQDVFQGGVQLLAQLSGDSDMENRANEFIAGQNESYNNLTGGGNALEKGGRIVGQTAAMPMPGIRATGMLARGGEAALQGAFGGALMPSDNLEQRATNAGIGAVAGPVLDAGLGYVTNKVANAKAGNLGLDDSQRTAMEWAQQNNAAITGDDISKNPGARWAGSFMDNLPIVGRGGYRKMQGEQAERLANDFISEISGGVTIDDAAGVVDASARKVLESVKAEKTRLYTQAFEKLDKAGPGSFKQYKNKAEQLLKNELSRGSQADQALVKELQKAVETPEGPMSFWHSVRSDLGGLIRQGRTGENQLLSDRAGKVLSELKTTIDGEFGKWASAMGGDAAAAWKKADKYYVDKIVPYRVSGIRQAIAKDDHEAILNFVMGSGRGMGNDSADKAKQVYNALDKNGRDAVSFAMIRKAADLATTDGKPFHPAIFARNLEAIEKRTGVFLPKEQKAYLDGMQKYMRYIEAAGQYTNNPPTGRSLYGALLGAGAVANFPMVAKGVAGTQVLRLLFNTERGKSLMLAMSKTTPESAQAREIAGQISMLISRGGVGASQPDS